MPIPAEPHLLAAAILLVTAAFVASWWIKPPLGALWRRAVIFGYLLALGFVLLWVATWAIGL